MGYNIYIRACKQVIATVSAVTRSGLFWVIVGYMGYSNFRILSDANTFNIK